MKPLPADIAQLRSSAVLEKAWSLRGPNYAAYVHWAFSQNAYDYADLKLRPDFQGSEQGYLSHHMRFLHGVIEDLRVRYALLSRASPTLLIPVYSLESLPWDIKALLESFSREEQNFLRERFLVRVFREGQVFPEGWDLINDHLLGKKPSWEIEEAFLESMRVLRNTVALIETPLEKLPSRLAYASGGRRAYLQDTYDRLHYIARKDLENARQWEGPLAGIQEHD